MYATNRTARRATEKQVAFISKLMVEKNAACIGEPENMTTAQASKFITELMARPRYVAAVAPVVVAAVAAAGAPVVPMTTDAAAPAPAPAPVAEVGMYRNAAGDLFKVQRSKTTDKLYAKALTPIGGSRLTDADTVVKFEFVYAPAAVFTLTAADRLTLEEAKAFGIRYGVCCVCGATLVDAKSVAAGIGPVCAGRI